MDRVARLFGLALVFVKCPPQSELRLEIKTAADALPIVIDQDRWTRLKSDQATPPEEQHWIVGFQLTALPRAREATVRILRGKKAVVQSRLAFQDISLPELAAGHFRRSLALVAEAMGASDLAALFKGTIQHKSPAQMGPHFLDRCVQSGRAMVLDGWVANLGERKIQIASADLQSWASRNTIGIKLRTDVSEHLRAGNGTPIITDRHGFTTVLPVSAGKTVSIYLVEANKDGDASTFYGPIDAAIVEDEPLALQLVESAYGEPWGADRIILDRCFRPLFQSQDLQRRAAKFEYGPRREDLDNNLTSIIVPIFADPFWMNCVIRLQNVLSTSFEIVVVNDDPRIAGQVQKMLETRSASTKIRTVLVQNVRNYGFGAANNIGVAAASGDVLILMNSDVFVDDVRPLITAANAIREDKNRLIGFLLLYEDDTIQHVGMEFRRSAEMANLYIADHPEKGLPFGDLKNAVREVPAVTGALMALSRPLYAKLNGFDPIYVKGDFEDADLCLRAREIGARVELHIKKGLYHLERQSIAQLGTDKARRLITYLNCLEFNRRWASKLDDRVDQSKAPARVFKIKSGTRPSAKLVVAG